MYKYEIRKIYNDRAAKRREESDRKSIENEARDNSRGKEKIRSRTSGPCGRELNHRMPRNFLKKSFTNPMSMYGYTDEEYRIFEKTGVKKEEQ